MNGNDGTSYNDWSSFEAESRKINDIVKDKAYLAFKKRISLEPEQVKLCPTKPCSCELGWPALLG